MVNDAAFMNLHFRDLRHDLVYLLFGRRTMSFRNRLDHWHKPHHMLKRHAHLKANKLVSRIR